MNKVKNSPETRNHRVRWALVEINYLETHYRTAGPEAIATHLGRTTQAVKGMARKLLPPEKPVQSWSEAERTILINHYESHEPIRDIVAMLPGRSTLAVMAMAAKMGLSRPDNTWTEDELSCLHLYYPLEGQHILRRLPAKSDEAIRDKARELNLVSPGHTSARQWREEEWQLLSQNRHRKPLTFMPLFPDRSLSSIKNALIRLKRVRGYQPHPAVSEGTPSVISAWSDAEKAILLRWYESSTTLDEIMAMLPGRGRQSVFSFARKLGLSRPRGGWTEAELQILRDYYPAEGIAVARRLSGRQTRTVIQKAFQLGLRRAKRPSRHSDKEH